MILLMALIAVNLLAPLSNDRIRSALRGWLSPAERGVLAPYTMFGIGMVHDDQPVVFIEPDRAFPAASMDFDAAVLTFTRREYTTGWWANTQRRFAYRVESWGGNTEVAQQMDPIMTLFLSRLSEHGLCPERIHPQLMQSGRYTVATSIIHGYLLNALGIATLGLIALHVLSIVRRRLELRVRRKRRQSGACETCGYLRSRGIEVCPECGEALTEQCE